MDFSVETVLSIKTDIFPFLQEYYDEVSLTLRGMKTPIPMNPDFEMYMKLEDSGLLRIYSARKSGMLIGFSTFVLFATELHHKGLKAASTDMIYVRPKYRGLTGTRLMAYAESQLKDEGVQLVTLRISKGCDWSALAGYWGYDMTEFVFQKWMGN